MDPDDIFRILQERHWTKGHSIRRIERDLALGKSTFGAQVKRLGYATRTRKEQIAITNREPEVVAKRSGEKHWAFGKRKESDQWAKRTSERMAKSNPSASEEHADKMAKGKAAAWRANPTAAEALMIDVLARSGAVFSFQHQVGPFVADFAFPLDWVILEIDNEKRDARRKADYVIRDNWLIDQGWVVVRALNGHAKRPWHLLAVLEKLVPSIKIIAPRPPGARQYRVLVRGKKIPPGGK